MRVVTCFDITGQSSGYIHLSCIVTSCSVSCVGMKDVNIRFCSCLQTEVNTLITLGLFPATPTHPTLVFTFRVLDLLEALVLVCQTAVKDFVNSLKLLFAECSDYPSNEVSL